MIGFITINFFNQASYKFYPASFSLVGDDAGLKKTHSALYI